MESYVRLLFWNAKVIKPKSFETLVLSKQEDRRTFCFADNWSGNPFCGTAFGRMAKIVDQLDLHEGDSISGECEISFSCKVVNGKKIFNSGKYRFIRLIKGAQITKETKTEWELNFIDLKMANTSAIQKRQASNGAEYCSFFACDASTNEPMLFTAFNDEDGRKICSQILNMKLKADDRISGVADMQFRNKDGKKSIYYSLKHVQFGHTPTSKEEKRSAIEKHDIFKNGIPSGKSFG